MFSIIAVSKKKYIGRGRRCFGSLEIFQNISFVDISWDKLIGFEKGKFVRVNSFEVAHSVRDQRIGTIVIDYFVINLHDDF